MKKDGPGPGNTLNAHTNVGCLSSILEIPLQGGRRRTIPYCRGKIVPDFPSTADNTTFLVSTCNLNTSVFVQICNAFVVSFRLPPSGSRWMRRPAGSSCGPVWTTSWCGASRWPCWRETAAGRKPRGGSASTCWTSTTTRRSFRRRRTWARWGRTSRRFSRWRGSG